MTRLTYMYTVSVTIVECMLCRRVGEGCDEVLKCCWGGGLKKEVMM